MTEQQTLLAQYTTHGSEEAFGELVTRFANLVYSTAVRLVDGDTHRAEDVVQTVFADLARRAKTLSPEVMLGGWLHRRTCHVAATLMRSERRRQNRERQAAEMHALQEQQAAEYEQIAPILDQVVNQLSAPDRQAILLRFFEGQDLQAVGQALSTTEDAARKRVARALDKLRGLLRRQGVVVPGASLATLLAAQAVTAAPAGLAVSVTGPALSAAATGSSGLTLALLQLMAITKTQIAVSTVVVAGIGTAFVLQHQAVTRLNEQNRVLQARLEGAALVAQDNQRLSNQLFQASLKSSLPKDQFAELLRLRGQVGLARRLAAETPMLRVENVKLRSASKVLNPPKEPEDPAEAAFQKETQRREEHLKPVGADVSYLCEQSQGPIARNLGAGRGSDPPGGTGLFRELRHQQFRDCLSWAVGQIRQRANDPFSGKASPALAHGGMGPDLRFHRRQHRTEVRARWQL